jgi:hypothetical protein
MKKLTKFMVSGALSLCVLAPALAQANTVHVTVKSATLGLDLSWYQSVPPTVLASGNNNFTDVAISGFQSTGTTTTVKYTDVTWLNASQGGGFNLFQPAPSGFLDYAVSGPQAYTSPESAPVFGPGNYTGTEFFSGATDVNYNLTDVVVGAPGPVPGAGLAGLAALALAGFYARARRA